MPDKSSDQEPSIEEILASIRQIIADDDEESAAKPAPAPEPPVRAPEPEPVKSDVLELTEVIHDDPRDNIVVDLRDHEDNEEEDLPPPPPPRAPEPEPEPEDTGDSILTDNAAHAALQGFARLASRTPVERQSHLAGITLEDIVRDLMRPMLRDWLDQNLPPLIEKLVAKELQRLARQAQSED
ncbi:MAG: DUF2497 domain-containing protein [Micavibrio aeruginosavorus]|uniref:DUF2497 domain-containing protein n=1 Tax=Micavibrio aeruginosavorus TaxID=349221 RepID=A0A7T5R0V9_9BACT|nr:MAG: DUF2497 domain-containing protein [Micavibrio aeruginosavorus]